MSSLCIHPSVLMHSARKRITKSPGVGVTGKSTSCPIDNSNQAKRALLSHTLLQTYYRRIYPPCIMRCAVNLPDEKKKDNAKAPGTGPGQHQSFLRGSGASWVLPGRIQEAKLMFARSHASHHFHRGGLDPST